MLIPALRRSSSALSARSAASLVAGLVSISVLIKVISVGFPPPSSRLLLTFTAACVGTSLRALRCCAVLVLAGGGSQQFAARDAPVASSRLHSFEPLDDAGDEMRVPSAAARRFHLPLAEFGGDAAHGKAALL